MMLGQCISRRSLRHRLMKILLNVALAFPILAWTSSSMPPSTEMMLPRYVKLVTSSSAFWSMIIGVLFLLLICNTLVFDGFIDSGSPCSVAVLQFSRFFPASVGLMLI
ncbi:hypothetical protein UPYG_G00204120 [Umbra pygmaea]|uniref:Uncharacterized protein n=1 Tax=Umbra pygmaea TaxID=75934 RepID=A0ABD0WIV0_UMBPY